LTSQITSGALQFWDALSGTLTRVAGEDVGSYAIQQGTLAASANYNLTYVGADLTITPKPITVTADAKSKVYGDSDPALTSQITSGSLVGSDSLSGSLTRVAGENAGSYAIQQGTLGASANYALTYAGANLSITQKPLLAQADDKSRGYGQTNPVFTITYTGFVGSDSVTNLMELPEASTTADTNSPIGTYDITLTGGSDTNYSLVLSNGTLTVTLAALTVTADSQSKVYGDNDPTLTYKITSGALLNGDSLAGTLTRVAGEDVGSYAIQQGSLAASTNYTLTFVSTNLTISTRAITVTADPKSKTYGDSDPALTAQVTSGSLVGSDSLSGSLTRAAGENVGTYAIQQGTLAASANYNLTYVGANLTINPAPITVTADAQSKTYGDADPALTSQITSGSLVGSDSLSGSLTRVAGENVGAYAIQQGTLAASANYSLTYVGANLTISPKAITVTADAKSKAYGDADPALTSRITSGSLVGSDSLSGNLTRLPGENAGSYAIQQGSLTAGGNYALTCVGANFSVTQKPLLAQADDQTRAYGQTNPVFTITYTGFVGSDSVTNLAELPVASTTADTNSPSGTYDITLTGGSDTNYSLVLSNGTLTVSSYTLTVSADNQSRAYGDANPALTGSLVGVENGDHITANYSTAATVTNFVGTYPITVTLSDPDGKLANYTVITNNATLTITNRPITVSAVPEDKVYDGTTTSATLPIISSGTLVNGDTANFIQTYNTKDVLTAHTLIPSGSVNDGNGGANYAVTFENSMTYSILPRPLTVAAGDAARVYGAPNPGFSANYSGFAPGEDASVLSGSPILSTTANGSSPVSGGPYPITVAQNTLSNPNYSFSPANGHLTVTPASATAGVASDKWTVPPTNNVTFAVAAVANAPSLATPSGKVQFVANGTNKLGSPITLTNGQATLSVLGSVLVHGSNTVTAVFSDAAGNFNGCSGALNPQQVVNIPPNKGTHSLITVLNTPDSVATGQMTSLDRDADGDPLTISAVTTTTTNGGTVLLNGGTITYTPPSNFAGTDSFTYNIEDPYGGTNFSTLKVSVKLPSSTTSVINKVTLQADGSALLTAYGTFGRTYWIQATDNLVSWTTIATVVFPASGVINYVDSDAANHPGRYYRLALAN
jgi:hypothetical protein